MEQAWFSLTLLVGLRALSPKDQWGVDALLCRGLLARLVLQPHPLWGGMFGACLPATAVSSVSQQCGPSQTAGGLVDQPALWPGGCSCSPGPLPSPEAREPEWWGLESLGRVEMERCFWLRKGPPLPLVAASPRAGLSLD